LHDKEFFGWDMVIKNLVEFITRRRAFLLLPIVLMLLPAFTGNAQLTMSLEIPDISNFPFIRVPFHVHDNMSAVKDLQPSNFSLLENGKPMSPLQLDCETKETAPAISFLFLLDVSLSMGYREGTSIFDPDSIKWKNAKSVLTQSFRRLRAQDEGALLSFAASTWIEQDFTPDKKLLEDAIDGLHVRPSTALYNALFYSSGICKKRPYKKAIILLTDGADVASGLLREQAISELAANHIPVYSIGLGIVPDNGRDDMDTLRRISEGTFGQAFYAPTSVELDSIYSIIIESIYTSDCVLSYTTPDTCRQGDIRNVEITLDVLGSAVTGSTRYRLPDFHSTPAFSIQVPPDIQHSTQYRFPLLMRGELRALEPTTLQLRLKYDSSLLSYSGIQTNHALLGGDLAVSEYPQGTLDISCTKLMALHGIPYNSGDTLGWLLFDVPDLGRNYSSKCVLKVLNVRQNCGALGSGDSAAFVIHGCPGLLALDVAPPHVFESGATFRLPIRLRHALDLQQSLKYSFIFRYDPAFLRYLGVESRQTISETMQVTVTEPAPGTLVIYAPPGQPSDTSGTLLFLRFTSERQKESRLISCGFSQLSIEQSCLPAVASDDVTIALSGVCSPLVARKAIFALAQNHPNPFSTGTSSQTEIEFSVLGTGPATVVVYDLWGRRVATLYEGAALPGMHRVRFFPQSLPKGVYTCILTEGTNTAVRKMIWLE
jgi:VWFA-related protein